ncbi:family 78 glycoside hydrolase catalytic domain, partial [Gemmatimonadota bacterium]
MNSYLLELTLVTLLLFVACTGEKKSGMQVSGLRCEYLANPLGIDETSPRLSWRLESDQRGQKQTAYRILVASNEENLRNNVGDLWDTGKLPSDRTTQVVYEGKELTSRQSCYWKVKTWDSGDLETEFSSQAFWTVGLLSAEEWKGEWIGMDAGNTNDNADSTCGSPVPCLRKSFDLDKPLKKALIYITARGIFECHLNGERVGKDLFAPGWTDYNKHIQYRTYDVTSYLRRGDNSIGILLADGWYSGFLGWGRNRAHYGSRNSVLCQLEVEYQDGSTELVVSDQTWRCTASPIVSADFQMGEDYDARKEIPGWATADIDDNPWGSVTVVEKPAAKLVAQPSEPVQVTKQINPVGITEPAEGVYVFDMGQNFAGWVRLKVSGERGTKVTLRFVERLNPDGTIYTTNLRSARCTDTYILKGAGEEVFEPRFTFHGFQYVEVTGFPGIPGKDAITGCVVHSTTPATGKFECSDPMVNKLWNNALWSQRGNFISIPTDCPQRDERLGWMGDAQIFVRTATFNMDVAAFFTKWMVDVEDAQSAEGAFANFSPDYEKEKRVGAPAWGDAGIIVPWTVYRVYGDTRIIEKHYDAMVRWMDFILEANPDFIRKNKLGSNYGDWLSIGADTPKELLATAYWALDAKLMSRMAKVLGYEEDSRKYDNLFRDVRAAFQDSFIREDALLEGDTQTGYLLALYVDLLPEDQR